MVSLIIPFATADPRRQMIFDWVYDRWHSMFPDWEIVVAGGSLEDFNRSRARNRAFEFATGDLIVVSDADTITTPDNIRQAVSLVENGRPWVIAHNTYYSLTETFTNWLLEKDPSVDIANVCPWDSNWRMVNKSEAGVLVMPRAAYEAVGGYDERFKGWGWEDSAFAQRMNRVCGHYLRTSGPVLHLWHDPGLNFDQPDIKYNEMLFERARDGLD